MKNLKSNITTLIFVFAITLLGFQSNAQTSVASESNSISIAEISIGNNKVNTEFNHNGNYDDGYISNEDLKAAIKNNYRYTSHFNSDLTEKIQALIIEELGQPYSSDNRIMEWNKIDGESIDSFSLVLKSGKVKFIYKYDNEEVMDFLEALTKKICKITYRHNCD